MRNELYDEKFYKDLKTKYGFYKSIMMPFLKNPFLKIGGKNMVALKVKWYKHILTCLFFKIPLIYTLGWFFSKENKK